MITTINLTASPTLEERIVAIANNNIDSTATKIVCVTNGNLLRYKTLSPISSTVYTGTFDATTGGQTLILTLPNGIKFEYIVGFNFLCYYNTVANGSWNAGLCWANDHDGTVYYAANSADNPSSATTFRLYRRTGRMALSPYRLTIQYYAV